VRSLVLPAPALALALALVVAACGEGPPAVLLDGATGSPDQARRGCAEEADGGPGECVEEVSGRVVDGAGAPIAAMVVSLCADLCFFGKTDADGRFLVEPRARLDLSRYAVLLHARPARASYYAPAPKLVAGRAAYDAPLAVLPLPDGGPAISIDAAPEPRVVDAGDVVLTVPAGVEAFLDPEDVEAGEAGRRLRAVRVEPPSRLPFVDGARPPRALFGLSPFEAVFSGPVRLSFANTTGLPAGAPVTIEALRGLLGAAPPAGRFDVLGGGRVSPDGARVEMDEGVGVTSLTWYAIHEKGK